ncbi:MAG: hypothetical protein HUU32_05120 [Calditrichaceae bacterium]|nr:hypothetical protein [Calditrichaceae bacterium]
MWRDPIIEEIHRIRQEHAAKFNFDLRAIVKYYQEQQKQSGRKVVSFSRPPSKETANCTHPQQT